MPAISASAPGKIILFGEHAVVYGRPAIAVPVSQVKARAVVMADPRRTPGEIYIQSSEVGLNSSLAELTPDHPIAAALRGVAQELQIERLPAFRLLISSSIPVASGLGSGAAVTVAIVRAVSQFLGQPLSDSIVSRLAFQVEKLHHGTPSGIDNTVITYRKPVYFQQEQPIKILLVREPFSIVIGDSGVKSPTSIAVGELRQAWLIAPQIYERVFDDIGVIVDMGRNFIEHGQPDKLGDLMNQNHDLLGKLGVSSIELDNLVKAARRAGALGAKLSGGGRGGNMIALVRQDDAQRVANQLIEAGAVRTIVTTIGK